jgi:hypothetical protein
MAKSRAQIQKDYRDRKRRGCRLVKVEVGGEVSDDLTDLHLLKEWSSEDPTAIGLALAVALQKLKRYQ